MICTTHHPTFRTLVIHNEPRVASGTAAIVLLMHGLGAPSTVSAAQSFVPAVEMLAKEGSQGTGRVAKALWNSGFWRSLAGEAIAMPGHTGSDVPVSEVPTLQSTVTYLSGYVAELIDTHALPIFLLGRSASGVLADQVRTAVNAQYGRTIVAGAILMSPIFPGNADTLARNQRALLAYARDNNIALDDAAHAWSFRLHEDAQLATDQPTLVITSPLDREVLTEERTLFDEYAAAHPLAHHVEIPGPHNLFLIDERMRASRLAAYLYLCNFIDNVISGRPPHDYADVTKQALAGAWTTFANRERQELRDPPTGPGANRAYFETHFGISA